MVKAHKLYSAIKKNLCDMLRNKILPQEQLLRVNKKKIITIRTNSRVFKRNVEIPNYWLLAIEFINTKKQNLSFLFQMTSNVILILHIKLSH